MAERERGARSGSSAPRLSRQLEITRRSSFGTFGAASSASASSGPTAIDIHSSERTFGSASACQPVVRTGVACESRTRRARSSSAEPASGARSRSSPTSSSRPVTSGAPARIAGVAAASARAEPRTPPTMPRSNVSCTPGSGSRRNGAIHAAACAS